MESKSQSEGSPTASTIAMDQHPHITLDLDSRRILEIDNSAATLLGGSPASLIGTNIIDLVVPPERAAAEAAVNLLASHAIVGYHGVRTLRKADGNDTTFRFWVRRSSLGANSAVLSLDAVDAEPFPWPLSASDVSIALAITDHDWVIQHVSSDIQNILGQGPEAYEGTPVLALVKPVDVGDFLLAIGHLTADHGKATLRVHLRTAAGGWQRTHCLVVAMCRHSPPRLGLAFASLPEPERPMSNPYVPEVDSRGDEALDCMDRFSSQVSAGAFSTRQWEILTRLIRGERVKDIAKDLFLSTSTVRNHLTAIYRKFGVRSQAELLATLLKEVEERSGQLST